MSHFPKIIQLLLDIQTHSMPNDINYIQNCELALACMLEALENVTAAPPGKITHYEETIHAWLYDETTRRTLDPETHEQFRKAIERIFMQNWTAFG